METATITNELFHHKRILIAAIGVIVLFSFVVTRPATITGYFTIDTYQQKINLEGDGSATYTIKDPVKLNSLRLSGRVDGPGEVRIYLQQGLERKLVYTNTVPGSTSKITGLATGVSDGLTGEDVQEQQGQDQQILKFEQTLPILPPIERPGPPAQPKEPYGFRNECKDTCFLSPNPGTEYQVLIQTEPGTRVQITSAKFSLIQ
ncbi:MAG: hypothetical protein ABIA93_03140 [Candidatus Woesearchaeota archaeon]